MDIKLHLAKGTLNMRRNEREDLSGCIVSIVTFILLGIFLAAIRLGMTNSYLQDIFLVIIFGIFGYLLLWFFLDRTQPGPPSMFGDREPPDWNTTGYWIGAWLLALGFIILGILMVIETLLGRIPATPHGDDPTLYVDFPGPNNDGAKIVGNGIVVTGVLLLIMIIRTLRDT